MFFSLIFLGIDDFAIYVGSGVHRPIRRSEIAVTPSDHLFILDQRSMRITHYSPKGEKIVTFGHQGQGPGEFVSAVGIDFWDGQLLVFDHSTATVHLFDSNGDFLKSIHTTSAVDLHRTRTGWCKTQLSVNPEQPGTIFTFGPHLNKREVAWQWVPKRTSPIIYGDETMKFVGMQPAKEAAWLRMDANRRYLYLAHMGTAFKITVIDSLKKEFVRYIQKDFKPTPYDREWGEGKVAEANQVVTGFKFKLEAPEYFPMIQSFIIVDDRLIVRLWTGNPDKRSRYIVMDGKGMSASLKYDPGIAHRVLATSVNRAFLSCYDAEKDEAYLVSCTKGDINKAAEEYPLKYDAAVQPFYRIR